MSYKEICENLLDFGSDAQPRGKAVIEILNATMQFRPGEHQIIHPLLPNNMDYICHEIDWYIKGDPYDLTIVEKAPIWKDHVQNGRLESNYGFWLKRTLPRALNILATEDDTRRAVAYIGNESSFDPGKKDVPCTNMMQFLIREEKLFVIVTMRSQDVFYGLRNDLAAFQFFAETVADVMKVPLERLDINVGSFHVYADKLKIITEIAIGDIEPAFLRMNFSSRIELIRKEWGL